MHLGIKLIGDGGSMRSYVRTQFEMTKSRDAGRSLVAVRNHVYLFPLNYNFSNLSISFLLFKYIKVKYKAPYYVISFALKSDLLLHIL